MSNLTPTTNRNHPDDAASKTRTVDRSPSSGASGLPDIDYILFGDWLLFARPQPETKGNYDVRPA